jgi:metal-responsive CopG/Arc/MetJ family transcriptional regulator/DNA-directed RNA polymerase subunit RPC12/RpoP
MSETFTIQSPHLYMVCNACGFKWHRPPLTHKWRKKRCPNCRSRNILQNPAKLTPEPVRLPIKVTTLSIPLCDLESFDALGYNDRSKGLQKVARAFLETELPRIGENRRIQNKPVTASFPGELMKVIDSISGTGKYYLSRSAFFRAAIIKEFEKRQNTQ